MVKSKKYSKAELDSVYVLKIVLFFIIGSLWLNLRGVDLLPGLSSLPVGLAVGVIFARHDHFMIDRKIEYVVLLGAALLSYIAPVGVVLQW